MIEGSDSNFGLLTHEDVVSAGAEESVRWTVEGFMRRGAYAMLAGESKSGKTALATHLAYCVAQGRPFLGMAAEQSPVLWLAYEESREERAYLCHAYGGAPVYTVEGPRPIDTPEGLADLRARLRLIEELEGSAVGLVVVDPLVAAVQADSLAEMVKARRAMQGLNDLRNELGVSVLLLHHSRKAGGARGDQNKIADSHQLQAAVSQWWVMEVRKGSPRTIQLFGKGRGRWANQDWTIRSSDEWSFELAEDDVQAKGGLSVEERFLDVLRKSGTSMTSAQIASAAGLQRRYAQNIATQLLSADRIRKADKSGKSDLWALVK